MAFAEKIWNNLRLRYQTLTGQIAPLPAAPKTITFAMSPYTVTDADEVLLCDATNGAISILLIAAASAVAGQRWTIKKIDTTANAATVSNATIDGGTSVVLGVVDNAVTVIANTTNYSIASISTGAYLSSTIATGSAVALTSGATSNITSIVLTAGDWDVSGAVDFKAGATTATTYLQGGSSLVSATLGAQDAGFSMPIAIASTAVDATEPIPEFRVTVAAGATQTVYLVAQAGFTISTLSAYGTLRARRWSF